MKSYKTLKKQLLEDKEIKKAYDDLEPEFILAKMIIEKRIKQGLSQKELAEKIGTKQPAIARLESGTYNPSMLFLKKTAKALNSALHISFD
ncbi:MAG: helix-turn-helix transcriptional regulator [Candidatus Magasanikbacteria bacterium]|jgi:predicted transcriptional regulator|nr:helix-turn-helix transcriptional regulator [Candidatus Magasanikbacteria bacterium]MBT4071857.1 helix-turn-helix transcriptional regulator [Candidatus Magasanikbacteria bacterium]